MSDHDFNPGSTNLAYLNGTNVYTGTNRFTGTVQIGRAHV